MYDHSSSHRSYEVSMTLSSPSTQTPNWMELWNYFIRLAVWVGLLRLKFMIRGSLCVYILTLSHDRCFGHEKPGDTWQDNANLIHLKAVHVQLVKQMNLPLPWGLLWKTYLWYTGTLSINDMALAFALGKQNYTKHLKYGRFWLLKWTNHQCWIYRLNIC